MCERKQAKQRKLIIDEKVKFICSCCTGIGRLTAEENLKPIINSYLRDIKREARRLAAEALNKSE